MAQERSCYSVPSMPTTVTARLGRIGLGVFLLVLFVFAYELSGHSQSPAGVTNVQFDVLEKDGRIVLHYDLTGWGNASDVFKVTIAVSTNGGATFPMTPRLVTGDVGSGVHTGVGKRIAWEVRDDVKRLQADAVVFRITAEMELPPRMPGTTSEVDAGETVSLRVRCNFAAPGYVFLRDGTLSVNRTSITLTLPISGNDFGFRVAPDRVLEVKRQGQGIRIRVVVKDWKGKDDKRDYYLYNANSTTVGVGPDGQIRVSGGGNIACNGCDDTMEKLFALLPKASAPIR